METSRKGREGSTWRTRRERSRLECRECEVICERVVSPWQCLRSGCACVYAYEDGETTYFGCLHKVFAPELDLSAFVDAKRRPGQGGDPYGPLRLNRPPRPECRITVERAYEPPEGSDHCCNPTFFHERAGTPDDTIRMSTRSRDEGRGPRG